MDRRLNSGPFVAYVFSSIYITKVGKEREGNSFLLVTTVHFRINIYSRRVQMRVTKRIDCSPPLPLFSADFATVQDRRRGIQVGVGKKGGGGKMESAAILF